VAKIVKKSFAPPEETRSLHKGKTELVELGGVEIRRVTHEPGWRWSECVKPVVGTDSCQVGHLIHVLSGRIVVRMDDGSEAEFGPGVDSSGARRVGPWGRTIYQHRLRRCSVRQRAIAESSRWPSARVEDADAVQRLRRWADSNRQPRAFAFERR
jgi:hypothetical protein